MPEVDGWALMYDEHQRKHSYLSVCVLLYATGAGRNVRFTGTTGGIGRVGGSGRGAGGGSAETDGEFHPQRFVNLEGYVNAYCTALDDLRQWVDQSDSFQGTDVSRHVEIAELCAKGSQRFLAGNYAYPRGGDVRAIMSEVGGAFDAMTRNDETCLQKMKACATALKAHIDYAYPEHGVLPFAGSY